MCSWKEASTIILAVLNKAPIKSQWNYSILTLMRSLNSSFMPNACVFPGGTTELSDGSKKWLKLFSNFGINLDNYFQITEVVPPLIKNQTGEIPKLLSLKISAIRETFEEAGILLCIHKNKNFNRGNHMYFTSFEDIEMWRSRVQDDSSEFFNLCLENNCCPDVNNLYLWSNWLTPTSMGKKRFDTAFFIASLNEYPFGKADGKETENLLWSTPEELIQLCKNNNKWLPPPQFYETARLLQFKDFSELQRFAESRSLQGCDRWMPVQLKTLNGSVSVLPGDDAYSFIDYYTPTTLPKVELTNEKFRSQFKVLHRMEFFNKIQTKIVVKNYNPKNGHKLPICDL